MAARKKKTAKKAVKKTASRAKSAANKHKDRKKPETLRVRSVSAGLTVNDIHRSLAWYTNVVGFVVNDRYEQGGVLQAVELRAGSATIWIGQDDFKKGRDRVKGVGIRLYCQTAQDVDSIADEIKKRGGSLDHEPVTQPWGSRDFGLTDPDGYKITIQTIG